jgi:hypothetical protein
MQLQYDRPRRGRHLTFKYKDPSYRTDFEALKGPGKIKVVWEEASLLSLGGDTPFFFVGMPPFFF